MQTLIRLGLLGLAMFVATSLMILESLPKSRDLRLLTAGFLAISLCLMFGSLISLVILALQKIVQVEKTKRL